MAYTATFSMALGASKAGLTLAAQIVDTAGANVGAEIAAGFVEIGGGAYILTATIQDSQRGAIKVYQSGVPGTILAIKDINPEELENADVKTSTRSTFAGGAVASVTAPVTVGTNNDKTGYALSGAGVTAVTDDIFAEAVEGAVTFRQWVRRVAAVLFGKSSGGGAVGSKKFRDLGDALNRVDATTDASGNRSSVSFDDT